MTQAKNTPRNNNQRGYQGNENRNGQNKPTYREQLRDVVPSILHSRAPVNANQWAADGVDHINISRYSVTHLGKILNLDHPQFWEHPKLGGFRSLNSLWFFLRAKYKLDEIRNLTGYQLKTFVDQKCGGFSMSIPNFRAVILDSAYVRVKSCKGMAKELADSDLPFDCYRVMPDGGLRTRFEHSLWYSGGYEEIRAALQEGRDPDFSTTMEHHVDDIYAGVLKLLLPDPERVAEVTRFAESQREERRKQKQRETRQAALEGQTTSADIVQVAAPLATEPSLSAVRGISSRLQSIDVAPPVAPVEPVVVESLEGDGEKADQAAHTLSAVAADFDGLFGEETAHASPQDGKIVAQGSLDRLAHDEEGIQVTVDSRPLAEEIVSSVETPLAEPVSSQQPEAEVAEPTRPELQVTEVQDEQPAVEETASTLSAVLDMAQTMSDIKETVAVSTPVVESETSAPVAAVVSEGFRDTRFSALEALAATAPAAETPAPEAEGRYAPTDEEGQA